MSKDINEEFLIACFYGNYNQCIEYISKGANVNYTNGFVSSMHWTVYGCPPTLDRIKIIELLLKNGFTTKNMEIFLKCALSNCHKFNNDINSMKPVIKMLLPKIKGWYSYNFSDWTDGREFCIEEQERLKTIKRALFKTPLPMDTQRYLCEFI